MSATESKSRNVGFGWEAIDIFLFSNGQSSSPPRKYHLRTDELGWWEATLNQLAKSHYGYSHTSIELYTLNGNRIEGPRELCDGMPCVAVVPPDTFTDAGYEKYLMKASRSFEKRKTKNANMSHQAEVRISDLPQLVNEKSVPVYSTDHSTLNAPEETITASTVTVKSLKSIDQRTVLPTPLSNLRNEKKRSNSARASILKTQIKSTKNFRRESEKNGSLKTNAPSSEIPDKSIENNPLSASLPLGVASSTPKSPISVTPLKCHTLLAINSKDLLTESLPLESLISDRQILILEEASNLYQNPVHEVRSVKLDVYLPPNVEEVKECDSKTYVDVEIQTRIETSSCEVNTALYSPPSNSKIRVIPATITSQANILNCDTPLGDNYIAVINKGDAVNLKLQIEIQNVSNHSNKQSTSNWKNVRETSSLSDIFKKRKSNNNGDEVVTATKSLESVICGINECYTKMVVVQCSCCGNKTTMPRVDTVPVYKDPNGFFILIPTTTQQENHTCFCCRDQKKPCSGNNALSALCVEELCKPETSAIYPCVQEVGMVMTLTGSFGSQTEERQRNGADGCLVAKTVFGNMMSLHKERYTMNECVTSPSRFKQKLEYIVSTANIERSPKFGRVDSYTQTEWCSILLEAHLHEDGRYSFHFPSLQLLKHNSLI